MTPPIDAHRISYLRPVIERLLPHQVALAASMIERIIDGAHAAGLGGNARHRITTRLKFAARAVARLASRESNNQWLALILHVDRIFGEFLVDAVCHGALFELAEAFDDILTSAEMPSDVKEIVLKYRYFHERTTGGEGWPELYQRIQVTRRHSMT